MEFAFITFTDRAEDGLSLLFTKDKIREGKIVDGPRNCGKTQGLLEVIHEDHRGAAVVVCVSGKEASIYRKRYREMFPDDPLPLFVPATRQNLEGRRDVFVDGEARMNDEARYLLRTMPASVRGVA